MGLAASYQSVNKRLQSQYREPAWGWGLRVAMSVTLPLVWGVFFDKESGAEWMAIAAECVSFIELKGNIGQRVRLLISASLLSILFCITGSLAGNYIWISLPGMFAVGFLSGLFKNLGDRGMGLALSVYIFYIIASAYPVADASALWTRCGWVTLGSLWTVWVGLCSFLFIRIGTPYRRTIATIWKSVAALAHVTGKGWDGASTRSSIREIYLKEKEVRAAIDSSLFLFEETSDQVSKSQKTKYALAQSRRYASLVSLHIIQISETAEQLYKHTGDRKFMVQVHSLFRALEQIGERMEHYLLTLKEEERMLVKSRIERMRKISAQLSELPEGVRPEVVQLVKKILILSERVAKLVERSLELLVLPGERRVYRAYSFTQTLNILHPKYIRNNIRQLLNFDSITTRYALRIGVAAFLGILIGYLLSEDSSFSVFLHEQYDLPLFRLRHHGYWIAFTAIIVSQPYFGATLKKGLERSIGTIAGIIVGSGFLLLPFPAVARFILVFFSSIFLIYFLRRQYSVATFFITLMLVGLLAIDPHFDAGLMKTRILCTLIGSALAIGAGFLLLPSWDKDQFPRYLADAITSNFSYFQGTFYRSEERLPWTRLKRTAESRNSNAFDSFTRFMQEPRRDKKGYANYYYLITHNVRITRELNNFHSETELDEEQIPVREKEKFYQLLYQCDDLFRENVRLMKQSGNNFVSDKFLKTFPEEGFHNMKPVESQMVYLEKMLIELKAINAGLHGPQLEVEQEEEKATG